MIDNKDKTSENIDKEKLPIVINKSDKDELPSNNINEINIHHVSPAEQKKDISSGNFPNINFNLNSQKSLNNNGKRYTNDKEFYNNITSRPDQQTPKPDDTSANKFSVNNNNIINKDSKPSPDIKGINVDKMDLKKKSENTSDSLPLKKNNKSSILSSDFKVDKNLMTRKMDFSFPVKFRGAEYFRLIDAVNKLLDTSGRDIDYNKIDKSLAQMELVLHYLNQIQN